MGSTRVVTTGSTTNFSTNYQPFGPQYGASGTDPNYKYTGKPQDSVSGLYYYGARYYDSSLGRFISRDPAKAGLGIPQLANPYSYVGNCSERYTDPSGACLDAWHLGEDVVALFAGILGFWWLQDADPSGWLQILQQFDTDWGPQAVQYVVREQNLPMLFFEVVIPASVNIIEQLANLYFRNIIKNVGYAIFGFFSTGLALTDFEAQILLSSAEFLLSVGEDLSNGGVCPNFFEAPPIVEPFLNRSSIGGISQYYPIYAWNSLDIGGGASKEGAAPI